MHHPLKGVVGKIAIRERAAVRPRLKATLPQNPGHALRAVGTFKPKCAGILRPFSFNAEDIAAFKSQ